jgi:hypothetical protein
MSPPDLLSWLNRPFSFPDLTGQKVFLLGLGGGCDVILAYALGQILPTRLGTLVVGNTKERTADSLELFTPHLARLRRDPPTRTGRRAHGTNVIDQGVPPGDEGCPWIVVLPEDVDEREVVREIQAQQFDFLLGIDTGGDSLVGSAESGDDGRDKRMLRVLRATGLPLLLVIAAPGSDGESTCSAVQEMFHTQERLGLYRGSFSLEPTFPILRQFSPSLGPTRTPRIILSAADGLLATNAAGRVVVPRGCRPSLPREWLTHAFAFAVSPG